MKTHNELNRTNRYLPKQVGVEVESYNTLMRNLKDKLPIFVSGNSESNRIYECQTSAINVQNPIDVLLLGEIVRRCIPNYTQGGSDTASCSAHCHASGIPTELSVDQLEVLMFGLMPFMSMTWCRSKYAKYTFRSSITGGGSCYARFLSVTKAHRYANNYVERNTWVKDQTHRWGNHSFEFRANENSPLWVYFITSILSNSEIVNKLTKMLESDAYNKVCDKVNTGQHDLTIFSKLIASITRYMIPRLLADMDNIVQALPEDTREVMREVLVAYLNEDEETYDKIVNNIVTADEELAETFRIIDKEVAENATQFNVVKEK
jgi:hypothetical protein